MSPTRLVGTGDWLKPATIAKVCGGRTVRTGRPARRVSTDSRTVQPGDCFVALTGDLFDGHDFIDDAFARGVSGVIVSRRIPAIEIPPDVFVVSVRDTGAALLELGAEHRRRHPAKVVGITGSCGKTSTKDMLGRTLESTIATVYSPRSFNNHVGVPLSLLRIEPDTEAAVIEIGTNSPGEVEQLAGTARPDIGIVTCVSEAHLSGLGSLSAVAREKAGLFRAMPAGGVAIVNGDDPACRAMADECALRTVRVGVNQRADWFATDVRFHGLGTSFLLQGERRVTLRRLGSHNVYNALLCIAAATELELELDAVLDALGRLPPSSRRLEHKQVGPIEVFDDTYNMNPASARAALNALAGLASEGRKVVVFGEMLELGKRSQDMHRNLGQDVARAGVDVLVTVGAAARPIADGAREAGLSADRIVYATDPSHALELLLDQLVPRDLVLCKASRRIGLDRLVDGLAREIGQGEVGG